MKSCTDEIDTELRYVEGEKMDENEEINTDDQCLTKGDIKKFFFGVAMCFAIPVVGLWTAVGAIDTSSAVIDHFTKPSKEVVELRDELQKTQDQLDVERSINDAESRGVWSSTSDGTHYFTGKPFADYHSKTVQAVEEANESGIPTR